MANIKRKSAPVESDEDLIRFGISIPRGLLSEFDEQLAGRHFENRSEAIRDLIRRELTKNGWAAQDGEQTATLTLILDKRKAEAQRKVMDGCREMGDLLLSCLHMSLNDTEELHIMVLRGPTRDLQAHVNMLMSVKGVLFGKVVPAAVN